MKAALRKLVRALPESFRDAARGRDRRRCSSIPSGWDQQTPRRTPIHLDAVQQAVVNGEQIVLGYVARDRSATTRVVHPLGLAAKGAVWYLVGNTDAGLRTFRVDRITSVEPNGLSVDAARRLRSARGMEAHHRGGREPAYAVDRASALVEADTVPMLRWMFGTRVRIGPANDDGRVEAELRGHNMRSLATELAGFGGAVEILDPPEVRDLLATIGRELTEIYG